MAYRRRTIREVVEQGITTIDELQDALLTAIQLEFSTIPPYLCAQWSIDLNHDPDDVSDMIQGVVVQEMLHFGLACNMFTATGGSLKGQIATPGIVPSYPTDGLPGKVHPGLVVSLLPLGNEALASFMSIEYPDGAPVVQQPASPPPPAPPEPPTIGEFYQTISAGFNTVFPNGTLPNTPSLNQVVTGVDGDQLFAINSVADAMKAIQEITDQGEGTSSSPDEGSFDPTQLAHYYRFAQVYYGKAVAQVGSGFQYSGAAIALPAAANFSPQPPNAPDQATFISAFTTLMTQLEACWTSGFSIDQAIDRSMFPLQTAGTNLIQAGATPQFTFQGATLSGRA
ncbi:MAG: ferritin-like protein [Acidobacteria bacterium]|nr:ferritin-like protein [Acidobacteriota bacterium]